MQFLFINKKYNACHNFLIVMILAITVLGQGCGIYSFTGASISPDVKTVRVGIFANQAANVNPRLSQAFTQKLKEKFVTETNLVMTNEEAQADLNYNGYITLYDIASVASQGNETTAKNRLTIAVYVEFTNKKNEEQNFSQSFTRFQEYPSGSSFESIESQLVEEIDDQIVQDIFNKSIANW